MSVQTGEDEMGLRRILDWVRMASILVLLLHFYYFGCSGCKVWQPSYDIVDRVMPVVGDTGLFSDPIYSKLAALGLLTVSLFGSQGKKEPGFTPFVAFCGIFFGLVLFFVSGFFDGSPFLYISLCGGGYLVFLLGGSYLARVVWRRTEPDLFNRLHEHFPQEERLLENEASINLPARYCYHQEIRDSWVNLVDVCRGTLVLGSPGSGKTWYVIEPIIRQYIQKGWAMLLYDFKYDDLSKLAYNYFLRYRNYYPVRPCFYNIQPDDPDRSNRSNPLHPSALGDITDAGEAARAVLIGMNMDWLGKQGEFFVESAINFVKSLIWFLRLYQDGRFCSWPHVVELAQIPYKELFSVLQAEPQLQVQVRPFVTVLLNGSNEQLDGQIASATIHLARLSSPAIYYIMSGDDFSLELNDPSAPKILSIGGNPLKTDTYGPVVSAYVNTINRLANRKGMYPLAEVFDEFSTIGVHTIARSIATGRSNKMAITLCLQDASQLRLAYGAAFADVVLNTCANVISGQVMGDTARFLAERFGRTMQDRESYTTTRSDLNVTQSAQLEHSLPISRISSLSSGEFVGMVADTPRQPIDLKAFCCRFVNDPVALEKERAGFLELPVLCQTTPELLEANFHRIRKEVRDLVKAELARISASPELRHFLL
jgi:YWFCY protein/TraM recognition site of TraD and TraG